MIKPDWSLPFEIMCDTSDYAIGAVLGQRKDIIFSPSITLEFDIEIHDKKGVENLAANHLSRLENPDLGKLTKAEIRDLFPKEQLMMIFDKSNEPWNEAAQILRQCHSGPSGGHHGIATTARKRSGNIFARDETPQKHIQVEAQAFLTSDAQNVVSFLKKLFARFGIPKALISDRGTHFCNYQMERAMKRYRVVHRFSTAYHPQINGQVKNTNRVIKRILEKTIGNNKKELSHKLDDTLWAFRVAFTTPLGTTSFRIIYGKACHLPVELEHKAYWVLKTCNMDLTKARDNRWYGPFTVSKDMKGGAIELCDEEGNEFNVNKQHVKPYQKDISDFDADDDITFDDEGVTSVVIFDKEKPGSSYDFHVDDSWMMI
ncbi:reverse transcriptase domain-containing protein [Tanacetum coccineum]